MNMTSERVRALRLWMQPMRRLPTATLVAVNDMSRSKALFGELYTVCANNGLTVGLPCG